MFTVITTTEDKSMNMEKELNDFLADPERKQQLLDAALRGVHEKITQNFQWQLPDTISKECNEFIAEHIAPEIRAHLMANKGVIIAAAKKAADEISIKLSDAMLAKVEKNLSTSWQSDKIIKSMFD